MRNTKFKKGDFPHSFIAILWLSSMDRTLSLHICERYLLSDTEEGFLQALQP